MVFRPRKIILNRIKRSVFVEPLLILDWGCPVQAPGIAHASHPVQQLLVQFVKRGPSSRSQGRSRLTSELRQFLREAAVRQVLARCDVFIKDCLKFALHLRMLVGDTLQLFGIILQVVELRLVVSLVLVFVPHY